MVASSLERCFWFLDDRELDALRFRSQFNIPRAIQEKRHGAPLKTILEDNHGCVKPGEMLLVLGRPGAGCTTLQIGIHHSPGDSRKETWGTIENYPRRQPWLRQAWRDAFGSWTTGSWMHYASDRNSPFPGRFKKRDMGHH